jgi:NTP pyrophosphatase (non-canonical NTP hydrolase)
MINELVQEIHKNAVQKGFWEHSQNLGEKLMLVVTEVAEAMEELREPEFDKEKFGFELADIVIRVCDIAGFTDVDLETLIVEKIKKNKSRPYLHGKTC